MAHVRSYHAHLMSHDVMAAGRFYERVGVRESHRVH